MALDIDQAGFGKLGDAKERTKSVRDTLNQMFVEEFPVDWEWVPNMPKLVDNLVSAVHVTAQIWLKARAQAGPKGPHARS